MAHRRPALDQTRNSSWSHTPLCSEISLEIDGKTEAWRVNARQRQRQDPLPPLLPLGLMPFPPAWARPLEGQPVLAVPSLLLGRAHHLGLLTYKAMLMTAPARRASVSSKPGQVLGGVPVCGARPVRPVPPVRPAAESPKRRPGSTSCPDD